MWHILKKIIHAHKEDDKLIVAIRAIAGFRPSNLALYRLATTHHSSAKEVKGFKISNERLEFLGDAILDAVVADYLFKKYPCKDEGFLTKMRSRIVNRESLNILCQRVGIGDIIQHAMKDIPAQSKILANTLEAIIGAIYLDKGYLRCKKVVIERFIKPYHDLQMMASSSFNYKSKIIEWVQHNNTTIRFEVDELKKSLPKVEFTAQVFVGDRLYGHGVGNTKKKATQNASQKTCELIGIK